MPVSYSRSGDLERLSIALLGDTSVEPVRLLMSGGPERQDRPSGFGTSSNEMAEPPLWWKWRPPHRASTHGQQQEQGESARRDRYGAARVALGDVLRITKNSATTSSPVPKPKSSQLKTLVLSDPVGRCGLPPTIA
jgi:hypothetical protein